MTRRRRSRHVRLLPWGASWWIGPMLGLAVLVAWIALHHAAVSEHRARWDALALLFASRWSLRFALVLAAVGCLSGLVAAWRADLRGQLLDSQRNLNSLKELSWREFERLVGEAYRRLGYVVNVVGQGGADGGVDLVLIRPREKILVQCKQWRANSVGASVVREMAGLMLHHQASGVKIVCVGKFTRDARAFADGKDIELVSGDNLLELVRSVQRGSGAISRLGSSAPLCPDCGHPMCRRYSRRHGSALWGCSAYPECNGTRAYDEETEGSDGWR
ncbi:restriction endonuclease [Burkholderia anthina]|uniref:restriction endonuclease n=1 Tax=Burkholderia anthina TaxID=179879 RepID=UPI0037CB91BF